MKNECYLCSPFEGWEMQGELKAAIGWQKNIKKSSKKILPIENVAYLCSPKFLRE